MAAKSNTAAAAAQTTITDADITALYARIKEHGTAMQKRRLFAQNRSNVLITHVEPLKYSEKRGGGVVKGGYNIVAIMSCQTRDHVGQDAEGNPTYDTVRAEVGTRNFTIWDERANSAGSELYELINKPGVTSLIANLYWNFDGKTEDTMLVDDDSDKRVFMPGKRPSLKVFSYDIIHENYAQPNDTSIPF